MDIIICQLNGKSFSLNVKPTETVISVKAKLLNSEGIPVKFQQLLIANDIHSDYVNLDNKKTLEEYNVVDGAKVVWVFDCYKCYMSGKVYSYDG